MKRTLSELSDLDVDHHEPSAKRLKPNTPISANEHQESIESNNSSSNVDPDEDNECCICMNRIELPIKLECGHVFCFLCLKEIRMQSSATFDLSTLLTNDACDQSTVANDDDGSDDNTDSVHHNRAHVEKFPCPYCRTQHDVAVIDKAKMDRAEWMQQQQAAEDVNVEQQCEETTEISIWQYSGRKGGWWAYSDSHCKALEQAHLQFLQELEAMQQQQQQKHAQSEEESEEDDHEPDNQDTSDVEHELKSCQITIEIGVREYVCDFAQMIQFDAKCPHKKRKIRRTVETKQSLQRSDSLKGCAGKFFVNDKNKAV